MGEQVGHALNFVNDHAVRMLPQKLTRVVAGIFALDRVFEVGVGQGGKGKFG